MERPYRGKLADMNAKVSPTTFFPGADPPWYAGALVEAIDVQSDILERIAQALERLSPGGANG